jgi:RNA polymerase sigma-70 factor, ECF subfamily
MDSEDFTRYWTKAQPVVSGYITSMVPDYHQAEDMLQNVAVVLLRKFSEYNPAQSFNAWALGVTRNEILLRRRTHARSFVSFQPDLVESVASAYGELSSELDTRTAALQQCFQNVKGRSWDMISLRYEQDLKPQQIAEKLSMDPGAVRTALSRIRASLQECIERRVAQQGGRA